MLLQHKMSNLDRDRRDGEVLNFSFVVAVCWHICLFSIFFIKSPGNIATTSGINSLNFIGSFLKGYDFSNADNNFTSGRGNKYLNFAKLNVKILDEKDYARIDDLLDKPGNIFLANSAVEKYAGTLSERLPRLNSVNKDSSLAENDFFDVKNLPSMQIYFKDWLPGPVKFDLYINERGRVSFFKKAITSGSFDADMAVQRTLIRTVFDTYHFGAMHRRTLELDLKQ